MLAVRWYLRYGLSYRDVEELLAERGIEVDHATIHRWVQHFTPLLIDAARPCCVSQHRQYANNRVECDHGRLKARSKPMRGLKFDRTASAVIRGHAFIQNLRRGHYELVTDTHQHLRLVAAFDELTERI